MSYHVQTSYLLLNGIQTKHLNQKILPITPSSHKYKNALVCICVNIFCKILHIHAFYACICCVFSVCTDIIYFINKKAKGVDSSMTISVGK